MREKKNSNQKEITKKPQDYKNKTKDELIKEIEKLNKKVERLNFNINNSMNEVQTSQLKFEFVFNKNPLLMTISETTTGEIIEANEAFIRETGFSREELVGKNSIDLGLLDYEDRKIMVHHLETKGELSGFEVMMHRKNGDSFYVKYFGEILPFKGKHLLLSICDDITEHKLAEKAINESENKFRSIAENAVDYIFLKNKERKYTFVNQAMQDLLGLSEIDILGKTPEDIFGLEQGRIIKEIDDRTFSGEIVNETRSLIINGQEFYFNTIQAPLSRKNDEVISIMGVVRDVTEIKKSEDRVKYSEHTLAEAQKITHVGDWEWNIQTNEVRCSDEMLQIWGIEQYGNIVSFEKIIERIHPDDLSNVRKRLEDTYKRNIPYDLEFRIILSDSSVRYIHGLANVEKNQNGKAFIIRGTGQDITARKQAEMDKEAALEALRESEEIFRLFMENSPIYLFFKDDKIRSLKLSRNFENMLGQPLEELLGKTMYELFPSDLAKSMVADDLHILNEGKIITVEEEFNGRFYKTTKFPIHIDGTPKYLAGYTLDITDSKLAEEEIKKLNKDLATRVQQRTEELEMKNKELESFSYSVSHDLRAPLRHISSYTDLLFDEIKECLSENSKRYFHNIINASKRMNALIEDLLTFSRMSRSNMEYKNIKMKKIVKEVIDSFSEETHNRVIDWKINDLPDVRCDLPMVRQVIVNLLQNALKYSIKVEKAEIEVGYIDNDNENIFYVKDNGVGFDEEYKDKLFGVFQRLHADKEFSGTGIGLALVKKIVKRHGGSVWAEGKINKGATFYFSLPK